MTSGRYSSYCTDRQPLDRYAFRTEPATVPNRTCCNCGARSRHFRPRTRRNVGHGRLSDGGHELTRARSGASASPGLALMHRVTWPVGPLSQTDGGAISVRASYRERA